MDNDNKIARKHKNEVMLFLKDELQPLSHSNKPRAYNLEDEYAKTRKNKSVFIWVTMIMTVVIALFLTFCVSKYVDYKNNQIKINIDVFSDLNLKNLLDIVAQTKQQQTAAIKEKSQLEAALSYGIAQAEQKRDADLFTLQSLKLRASESRTRSAAIRQEYYKTVQALHAEYDVSIATQDSLITEYQKQLSEFDSNKVEQAKEQEAVIDSERQLHELEKIQITEKYEKQIENYRLQLDENQKSGLDRQKKAIGDITTKYQNEIDSLDPIIKDKGGLIKKASDIAVINPFLDKSLTKGIYSGASQDFLGALSETASYFEDFNKAKSIVSAIPQKNSIPSYVNAMETFAYSAGKILSEESIKEINRLGNESDSYKKLAADTKIKMEASLKAAAEEKQKALKDAADDKANALRLAEEEKNTALNNAAAEKASALKAVNDEKIATVNTLTAENNMIKSQKDILQTYMETICLENKWNGIIINCTVPEKIPVYLVPEYKKYLTDPIYSDKIITGAIKRKTSTLSKVTFSIDNGTVFCKPDDVTNITKVKPGDSVFVDIPTIVESIPETTVVE